LHEESYRSESSYKLNVSPILLRFALKNVKKKSNSDGFQIHLCIFQGIKYLEKRKSEKFRAPSSAAKDPSAHTNYLRISTEESKEKIPISDLKIRQRDSVMRMAITT
jgi:hypothetical protein